MTPAKSNRIILGDWGNTAARLFLVENGQVVNQSITSDGGVKSVLASHALGMPKHLEHLREEAKTNPLAQVRFDHEFEKYNTHKAEIYASEAKKRIGDWLKESPKAAVVLCGAIGSQEGWSFASYLKCPVDVTTLSDNLYAIPKEHLGALGDRHIYISRGVKDMHVGSPMTLDHSGTHFAITGDHQSIMRGEPEKAAGAYDKLAGAGENLVCMPGTHSQWLSMTGSTINSFWSFPTGEDFENAGKPSSTLHGPLSMRTSDEKARWESFWEGVHNIGLGRGILAARLGVRASVMTGDEGSKSPVDFYSGMLVADEIKEATQAYGRDLPLTLIINPGRKADYYRAALTEYFKYPIARELNGDEMSLEGLKRISADLVTPPKPVHKSRFDAHTLH